MSLIPLTAGVTEDGPTSEYKGQSWGKSGWAGQDPMVGTGYAYQEGMVAHPTAQAGLYDRAQEPALLGNWEQALWQLLGTLSKTPAGVWLSPVPFGKSNVIPPFPPHAGGRHPQRCLISSAICFGTLW